MKLTKAEKFFLAACLIFLPTQLGKHFFFDFSYIYSLPVDYLAPTVYFWDLLVIGLIFIWISQKPKINLLALNLTLVFLFTQSLSLFNSINPGASAYRLEQLFITGIFGTYLASQKFLNIAQILKAALIFTLFYQVVIALGQFFLNKTLGLWILGERTFTINTPSIAKFDFFGRVLLRPYSTFPHPNVLGSFIVLSIPLIAYLKKFNGKTPYWLRSLQFLSISLGFLVIALSFSRTAIFLGFFELFFLLKSKLKYLIIPLLIFTPFLIIRFLSAFNFDQLSLIRREELAEIAIKYFVNSPILGIGLNNFINQVSLSDLVSGPSRFLQPVHNIFLLTLAETGLVGFAGLIVLIVLPIRKLVKSISQNFSKILLFCWFCILFLGIFDHYFLTLPQGQRLFFLIWGLSFLLAKDSA